jgi:hypothetical protein
MMNSARCERVPAQSEQERERERENAERASARIKNASPVYLSCIQNKLPFFSYYENMCSVCSVLRCRYTRAYFS